MEDIKDRIRIFFNEQHVLSPEDWDAFSERLKVSHFKKKEYILRPGQIERNLYFVAQGALRHFHLKDGNEYCFHFAMENEFTSAYFSFLERKPARCYVQALEDTTLLAVSKADLDELYVGNWNAERLGRLNAERLYKMLIRRQESLLLETPDERFNRLLKEHPDWIMRVPQRFLASYIGLTPETYSRVKKRTAR